MKLLQFENGDVVNLDHVVYLEKTTKGDYCIHLTDSDEVQLAAAEADKLLKVLGHDVLRPPAPINGNFKRDASHQPQGLGSTAGPTSRVGV